MAPPVAESVLGGPKRPEGRGPPVRHRGANAARTYSTTFAAIPTIGWPTMPRRSGSAAIRPRRLRSSSSIAKRSSGPVAVDTNRSGHEPGLIRAPSPPDPRAVRKRNRLSETPHFAARRGSAVLGKDGVSRRRPFARPGCAGTRWPALGFRHAPKAHAWRSTEDRRVLWTQRPEKLEDPAQCADEALGLAVGPRPVGLGAQGGEGRVRGKRRRAPLRRSSCRCR